jgi:hypothetical protein
MLAERNIDARDQTLCPLDFALMCRLSDVVDEMRITHSDPPGIFCDRFFKGGTSGCGDAFLLRLSEGTRAVNAPLVMSKAGDGRKTSGIPVNWQRHSLGNGTNMLASVSRCSMAPSPILTQSRTYNT